jgi:peptidoglycan/LPS O-acetylase OafA/YrhL
VLRLNSLTGLRWWAAFAVFAHHMTNFIHTPFDVLLRFGSDGVMFFFILSGFVLTWSASQKVTARTFWVRRFARIYPAHFVALIVAIPVFYSFAPDPTQTWVKPVSVGILALSLVLLQGWSTNPTVEFSGNPAAWTLSCEAFFYALHPFINRGLRLLTLRGTLFAGIAVVIIAFAYKALFLVLPAGSLAAAPLPVTMLTEFAIGMCAAHAMRLGWRPKLPPFVLYVVGALFVLWLWYSPAHFQDGVVGAAMRATGNEWLIVLCTLLIISVASRDLRGGRSLLRSRPLVALGDWSYAFYLVHATIMYAVLEWIVVRPTGLHAVAWYAGLLAAAIAGAAALHFIVEKPCERFLRKWWDRRLRRQAEMKPALVPEAGAG